MKKLILTAMFFVSTALAADAGDDHHFSIQEICTSCDAVFVVKGSGDALWMFKFPDVDSLPMQVAVPANPTFRDLRIAIAAARTEEARIVTRDGVTEQDVKEVGKAYDLEYREITEIQKGGAKYYYLVNDNRHLVVMVPTSVRDHRELDQAMAAGVLSAGWTEMNAEARAHADH
jgi:hypothetical protein